MVLGAKAWRVRVIASHVTFPVPIPECDRFTHKASSGRTQASKTEEKSKRHEGAKARSSTQLKCLLKESIEGVTCVIE